MQHFFTKLRKQLQIQSHRALIIGRGPGVVILHLGYGKRGIFLRVWQER